MGLQIYLTRYCPFCRKYTVWNKSDHNTEHCEKKVGGNHCYLKNGAYVIVLPNPGNVCGSNCHHLHVRDEDIYCCGRTESYDGRRKMLLAAMGKEILNGVFDPVMWSPTFPVRTCEPIKKIREAVSDALEKPLIFPHVTIVCTYLFWCP